VAPETIFGIALAAMIVFGLVAKLIPKRQPASKVFKCSRCGTTSTHNDRTTEGGAAARLSSSAKPAMQNGFSPARRESERPFHHAVLLPVPVAWESWHCSHFYR
jgi:hypothetical protein